MSKTTEKAKLFDIKKLPMDLAHFFYLFLTIVFRMKRIDTNGKPYKQKLKGAAIIAANHIGFSDPFLTYICFWYRRIYCLASEEVMAPKLQGILLRGVGCIKIDRTIFDIEAIRKAIKVLKDEHRIISVFPQGHIEDEKQLEQIKSGAILIAAQSGSPIIPVYFKKAKHFFERRIAVIGEPIILSDYCDKKNLSVEDINKLSDIMLEKMQICKQACIKYEE